MLDHCEDIDGLGASEAAVHALNIIVTGGQALAPSSGRGGGAATPAAAGASAAAIPKLPEASPTPAPLGSSSPRKTSGASKILARQVRPLLPLLMRLSEVVAPLPPLLLVQPSTRGVTFAMSHEALESVSAASRTLATRASFRCAAIRLPPAPFPPTPHPLTLCTQVHDRQERRYAARGGGSRGAAPRLADGAPIA